jgi:hypothetical protein
MIHALPLLTKEERCRETLGTLPLLVILDSTVALLSRGVCA